MNNAFLNNLKSDIPASIVVFFVAIPLCLGIALASGAPLFSGIIAGIIGGIVVGLLSGSQIGVSGPAAGLAAIVLTAISTLNGFENFLLAVVIGGVIQLTFGILKAGVIGQYFPSSVIKGMLTGIGLIIFIKQIPYFFGNKNLELGSNMLNEISLGSTLVGIIGLFILILWESVLSKKAKIFQLVQGPLVAVIVGIIYTVTMSGNEKWGIVKSNLVDVPVPSNSSELISKFFTLPNFSAVSNIDIWVVAFTIALVASLETLLCVEATDKLDPQKRVTPKNRELIAQGVGNMLSGMIGGLPVTQVIVRSSANLQSGGKTKSSAIIHGFLLLISVLTIPALLNKIPLSVLASILFLVGYKLAKPALFKSMYHLGWKQFVPFMITIIGIIFTDLLMGISMGLALAIVIILIESYKNSHTTELDKNSVYITLAEEVTFINKDSILSELDKVQPESSVNINMKNNKYLDNDIIEILNDFLETTSERKLKVTIQSDKGTFENPVNINEINI